MNILSKIIQFVKQSQYHIFLASCIGLIAFISYNLGRIEALEKTPIKISGQGVKDMPANLKADIFSAGGGPASGGDGTNFIQSTDSPKKVLDTRVVVSKASTSKKYHYIWCPGAKKINETNKVWFTSDKEAEAAGYTLAGNCKK